MGTTNRTGKRSSRSQLDTARKVIERIKEENIVFTKLGFYRWSKNGVWEVVNDRTIKQLIHRVLPKDEVRNGLVNAVTEIIKTEIWKEEVGFNINKRVINCLNGELHLTAAGVDFRPHNRLSYCTTQIPVTYDPEAMAPLFENFLEEIFEPAVDPTSSLEDQEKAYQDARDKKTAILEMLGYTLLSSCLLEKSIILIGNGANGKSVLLSVVEALCGRNNVAAVSPAQFDNKFQRAHLYSKLANIVTEIAEGSEIAEAPLKAIISGDLVTAEQKHQPPFDFHPFCTCWFGTNHLPHTRDFSNALFRRILLVTCNNHFDGDRCNPHLKKQLLAELPGILNLALTHLKLLNKREAFTEPSSSKQAKGEWALEVDQVAQFVEENCTLESNGSITSQRLYEAYENWAEQVGINRKLNRKNFTNRLKRIGVQCHRGTGGTRLLTGIRLSSFL